MKLVEVECPCLSVVCHIVLHLLEHELVFHDAYWLVIQIVGDLVPSSIIGCV